MPQPSPATADPADVTFTDGFATAFAPMAGPGAPRAPVRTDPFASADGPVRRLPDLALDGEAVPAFETADPE